MRKIIPILLFYLLTLGVLKCVADDICSPTVTYTDNKGTTTVLTPSSGETPVCNAPLDIQCEANPSTEVAGRTANYEWHFTKGNSSYLVRYEEDTNFTFRESGTYAITLYASFVDAATEDTVTYESEAITLTISNSVLQMPNAFSPNGDGRNDYYQAKSSTIKSIIEFKATIFNRWGQKLYQWTDPYTKEAGWDGTYNGQNVGQGVYFVRVDAKGADGTEYHIKKDVNLLRDYEEAESVTGSN